METLIMRGNLRLPMVPVAIRVYKGGVVKLPASVRREAGIEEGDVLLVSVKDGRVILTPKKAVDPLNQLSSELGGIDENEVFEQGLKAARTVNWRPE